MNAQVQQGAYAPTKQHGEIYTDLAAKLQVQLTMLRQIEDADLAAFNKLLEELKVPAVFISPRKVIS